MAEKRNPLGPIGEAVRENFRRLRGDRTYQSISDRLDALGRPIPPLGLRRIESGDRRVDVDDLVALAEVLEVSPVMLLMPATDTADQAIQLTSGTREIAASTAWLWLSGSPAANPNPNAWPKWMATDSLIDQVRLATRSELSNLITPGSEIATLLRAMIQQEMKRSSDGDD